MHRQTLVFDSNGKLTSEALDRLAEEYEDCLASGDLTFEKLQTRRFADAIIEPSDNGKNSVGTGCWMGIQVRCWRRLS